MPRSKNNKPGNLTQRTYLIIFLFILALTILWQILRPCSSSVENFLKLITIGISILFLGKIVEISITYKQNQIIATGGAAIFIIIIILFVNYFPTTQDSCDQVFNKTVSLKDSRTNSDINQLNAISLTINSFHTNSIYNSTTSFHTLVGIPKKYISKKSIIKIEMLGWEFENFKKDTAIILDEETLTLNLYPDTSYCCITGYVLDDSNNPIQNSIVSINGNDYKCNSNGWFKIEIPRGERDSSYTAKISADGFNPIFQELLPNSNQVKIILEN